MAIRPYDNPTAAEDRAASSGRNVGEHVFIWIGWALAAAFWGATLTTMVEIFRAAAQPAPGISTPGALGGSAYLALVVTAFLIMAGALAYAALRSAMSRHDGAGEAATAALYNAVERQGGDDLTGRSPDRARQDRDFH